MSLSLISAAEAVCRLAEFDTVIDARSETEYALDRLPGALNWPTLNDEERKHIGTLYVQVNQFEAKKLGAAWAARNIARHIERDVVSKTKDWKPLAYCWRGGKRSGALSLVLDQIGFKVSLIQGGYKAFRAAMLQDLQRRVAQLRFTVVCGTTGSGKTRLLHALKRAGAQVLDLEALACHRSSVLGAVPGMAQPSQKHFDTLIWDALRLLDHTQPVYIESESKKVGNVSLPAELTERMRESPCINLLLPWQERVALLMEDYAYWVHQPELLGHRLDVLTELRGKAAVNAWKEKVALGQFESVVADLLQQHYDPGYLHSIGRNFSQFSKALEVRATSRSDLAMDSAAQALLKAQNAS